MRDNPFTPSFGTLPAVLVGRDEVLTGIAPIFGRFTKNDIHWATHLRAHRGAGKTVLLDQIQDEATRQGWWVLQEDAGAGAPLTNRIINRALIRLAELDPPRRGRQVTALNVFGSGIEVEPSPAAAPSVTSVRDVLDAVAALETNGVLVTIDEVHQAPDAALNEIGNAAQHLHRDGRRLAFVMAGLPRPVRTREATFLSRCWDPPLGKLTDRDVERGLVETAARADGTFEPLALRAAVDVAAGEPFLMQLIGYHGWELASRRRITVADITKASPAARDTYKRAVTAQMVASVSPDQREFLGAMARHGTPTRLADIRADGGWSQSQAGMYRQRLIDAGLIVSAGYGLVDFALPGIDDLVIDDA
ncbi:MAG TPA: ATP-binding protein [Candidatus Nanopelagicales bacterium]|nr:ATP-binding protein [Candidatus Nanopelagicales bacterium]